MKHTPDCIGGEMEGWVLLELKRTLKVQHNKDLEVIVIKGVANYGDHTKEDQWQWTAAKAAMDCIHYCLNKSGGIEFGGKYTFIRNCNVGRQFCTLLSLLAQSEDLLQCAYHSVMSYTSN